MKVALSVVLAAVLMIQFEGVTAFGRVIPGGIFSAYGVGGEPLGPVGIALGSGIAAWIEWALLKRALRNRIGHVGGRKPQLAKMFGAAAAAAAAGWGVRLLVEGVSPFIQAALVFSVFGVVYFGVAGALKLEQSDAVFRRVRKLLRR